MSPVLSATLLLVASNVFMTFAWYAHLKNLADRPWYLAAVASWGIAFFEYLLQVPGNRVGYTQLSLPQLKILQEVITLGVFVAFAVRINYAIFGNQEAALHAHVIPRYVDEPEEMRGQQPWAYNWSAAPSFDRLSCQQLAEGLLRELTRMGVTKPMRYTPGANAEG